MKEVIFFTGQVHNYIDEDERTTLVVMVYGDEESGSDIVLVLPPLRGDAPEEGALVELVLRVIDEVAEE